MTRAVAESVIAIFLNMTTHPVRAKRLSVTH
jgi:hypothetical protein